MGLLGSVKRFALCSRRLMRLLGGKNELSILSSTERPGSLEYLYSKTWAFVCMFEIAGHRNDQIPLFPLTDLMSAYGFCLDPSYIIKPYC